MEIKGDKLYKYTKYGYNTGKKCTKWHMSSHRIKKRIIPYQFFNIIITIVADIQ